MTQTQRSLLTDGGDGSHARDLADHLKLGVLAALVEGVFELVAGIEVVFDASLIAALNQNHMINACRKRLLYNVLQSRFIDDGQHLLWNRLRRRKKARAEAGDRDDGEFYGLRHERH